MYHQNRLKHIRQQTIGAHMQVEFKQFQQHKTVQSLKETHLGAFIMRSSCAEYTNDSTRCEQTHDTHHPPHLRVTVRHCR